MKIVASMALVLFVSLPARSQGAEACEELKSEIAKKLDGNNVKSYTLEIVGKDAAADGKVVGIGGWIEEDRLSQGSAARCGAQAAPSKK